MSDGGGPQRGRRATVIVASGMDYSLKPGMFVDKHETWRGVECYDLFNSPNLSPQA